jgi:hypothetical protein
VTADPVHRYEFHGQWTWTGWWTLVPMLAVFFAITVLYFLPTIIAVRRNKAMPNILTILAVNLCLGWTVAGWIFAFRWAIAPQFLDVLLFERNGQQVRLDRRVIGPDRFGLRFVDADGRGRKSTK